VVFYGFGKGLNAAKISRELKRRGSKVTTATIDNILNKYRTILYESLKATKENMKLGGPGQILEMY
jgi:transposase-like protein